MKFSFELCAYHFQAYFIPKICGKIPNEYQIQVCCHQVSFISQISQNHFHTIHGLLSNNGGDRLKAQTSASWEFYDSFFLQINLIFQDNSKQRKVPHNIYVV